MQQGSLYPALHRLERRGWIKAQWGLSDNNRRAKYYELTRTGRKQLEAETDSWRKLTRRGGTRIGLGVRLLTMRDRVNGLALSVARAVSSETG